MNAREARAFVAEHPAPDTPAPPLTVDTVALLRALGCPVRRKDAK